MRAKRIWIAVLAFGLLITLTQGWVTKAASGMAFTCQGWLTCEPRMGSLHAG